jgi:hypothetical protein
MARAASSSTARFLRAVFILGVSMIAVAASATGAQPATKPSAAAPAASATVPQPMAKPLWAELTPVQQQALAPLASEWDNLDAFRKNKWLAIGNKYASMKPDEQQRVQERMRDWVKLTPEQRRMARQSYARAKKLDPDQKSAKWEQYQQLPEEEKKKLAADAASKKNVATLPPPAAQGTQSKTIPPIKAAPKPVLEKSVTPQAASQSRLQQPAQPNSK